MIVEKKPLTMAQAKEVLKDYDTEKSKMTSAFIKKFTKLSGPEAEKIFENLKKLNLEKLKDEDLIKIVDFMPEDVDSLRKIFIGSDISLEQDEITKILEVTNKK
jgi:DNA-directed RNA polymerase subunit F